MSAWRASWTEHNPREADQGLGLWFTLVFLSFLVLFFIS
jgi:hypothetical protein